MEVAILAGHGDAVTCGLRINIVRAPEEQGINRCDVSKIRGLAKIGKDTASADGL